MNDHWVKMALEQIMKGQEKLAERVEDVQDKVHHLDKCLDSLKLRVDDYREDQREEFENLKKTIASMVPNGDFAGHCKDHETRMKKATRWEQWQSTFMFELLRSGLLVGGGWALYALWDSFKLAVSAS